MNHSEIKMKFISFFLQAAIFNECTLIGLTECQFFLMRRYSVRISQLCEIK